MKNHIISPIQKVILFQYNNKTYYEKCVFWIEYYVQWLFCWFMVFCKNFEKKIEEYIENTPWLKASLEKGGIIEKRNRRRRRPKATNEMLEFIEIQYENWEEKMELMIEDKKENIKSKWGNENIEDNYYDKEEFIKIYEEIVTNPDNKEEKKWKSRVMIVYVPMIGNIMMYYDIFRMSFVYYSDTKGIHYNILNACAMRYVVMFHCMDLFMDEIITLRCLDNNDKTKNGKGNWKSSLRWMNKIIEEFKLKGEETEEKNGHRGIYEPNSKKEEGKGIKLNKEEKEKLFAKLKQYRTEYVPEDEIILRNKFVFKGKTMDSYYQIFCKKQPEVKVTPINSSKDIKNAFYSGVLPLKMPKFWEIEEQNLIAEKGGEEKGEEELSSYAKYKKEKGLWNKK